MRWRKKNPGVVNRAARRQYINGIGEKRKSERISRKRMFVDECGGKCMQCGYDRNLASLEWHHSDPEFKEGKLSVMIRNKSISDKIIREEINKCMLLCRNCHGEVHNPDFNA